MLFKDKEKEINTIINPGAAVPLFEQLFLTDDIGDFTQIIQMMALEDPSVDETNMQNENQ